MLKVGVTEHAEFTSRLVGQPNVERVFVLSDKTFYRPNETGE